MPVHTTTKITYNPIQSKVYVHQISPSQVEICIVGEDTQITGIRLKELTPQGTPAVGSVEVTATL